MSRLYTNEGKVKEIQPTQEIGKYYKQTVVFTEMDEYPQDFAVDFWNAKLEEVDKLKKGDHVEITFRVKSREHKGKWYTNLSGFQLDVLTPPKPRQPTPTPRRRALPRPPSRPVYDPLDDEDVPF